MTEWKCFELHTHTLHSDGNFSVAELRSAAGDFLYDGIALTDHNTMSGMDELKTETEETMPVIPGIEWTTYYGHMVVLGAEKYIDWRFARPDTIDEYTKAIKEAGGVTGIAHPFNLGSPMCTGCYWDFKVQNWNNIDYIEVWSSPFPQRHLKNEMAFKWWTELLNKGHHLAASSGWDWHRPEPDKPILPAATWLGLENGVISSAAVRQALSAGRTIVSIGPYIEPVFTRKQSPENQFQEKNFFLPGETLSAGTANFSVTIDENRRKAVWGSFGIHTEKLCLIHNGAQIYSASCGSSLSWEQNVELSPGWIRLEGYGELEGKKDTLLFFTSPWYIR